MRMLRTTLGNAVWIETALHDALWPALVDLTQFEFNVIVMNARDAMAEGGAIIIGTTNVTMGAPVRPGDPPAGEYVAATVSDTESGMQPDVLAKAFEPFFTTKPVGRGSGLGLSQVYGFTRQSGGGAAHRAGAVGKGRTSLYLPRARRTTSMEVAARPHKHHRDAALAILVVDDDTDVRGVTASMLADLGYNVVEAGSGAAALDRTTVRQQLNS